jgi:hypothetical protein
MKKITIFIFIYLIFTSCSSNKTINTTNDNNRKDNLAFELCQIYGLDQGIRDEFLWSKHIEFGNVHLAIDTLSFNRVTEFVIKNGFPTKQLVGEKNYQIECVEGAAIAVLLHNPHRLVNEKTYFDLFLKEVNKGNLKATTFADLLDKYYWASSKNKKNRRVFYGSQFGKPCIQTKDATNIARIEIGLKPLDDDGFVDCEGEELDMPKERK